MPEWMSCCGKAGLLLLSRPMEGVFQVLPVIYAKFLPSMVELGWILEAGDHLPRQSPECCLGGRGLHAKAALGACIPCKDKTEGPNKGQEAVAGRHCESLG